MLRSAGKSKFTNYTGVKFASSKSFNRQRLQIFLQVDPALSPVIVRLNPNTTHESITLERVTRYAHREALWQEYNAASKNKKYMLPHWMHLQGATYYVHESGRITHANRTARTST